MNIFARYKNYREERRLSRLEGDLMKINERYEYNPFKYNLPNSDKELASRRLVENFAWHSASIKNLSDFYKRSGFNLDDNMYFWTKANEEIRKVHSGIPNLISRKMATILFGNGYDTTVTVYKDGQEDESKKDEKASKKASETLNLVCQNEKVNLKELLKKAAIAESWSGHISAKFSVDTDLSPFPILEIYDKRSFEVIKKRGITQAIIYKSYYKKGSNDYILHEVYTTGLNNISVIRNELYFRKGDGTLSLVSLTTLPETAELEPELSFPGLTGMLALEKPNLNGSGEFVDSIYGVSDYAGGYSTYDSLDEIISEIVAELRTHKTKRYIPDVFLPVDENGKILKFDDFVTNYVVTHNSNSNNEGHDPQINITKIEDKTQQHYEKYKVYVAQACNNAGLSPLSLGITGLESINSSDKSTRERAKTTLETRNDKIELWKPFLQNLLGKLMEIASWIQTNHPHTIPKGIPKIDTDYSNTDILVTFADYVEESQKERIENWGLAKQYGIASVDLAVRKIHGDDLSESDIIDEINRIKFEQGIMFNTPDSLQLTGTDEMDKKKKEQQQEQV